MRFHSVLAGVALIAGTAQAAGYEPRALLGTGYFEHPEADGTWFVGANSRGTTGSVGSEHLALYRAAALAREQGHRYVQLLRVRTRRTITNGVINSGENTHLEVRFTDSAGPPADCRQPKGYTDQCRTFDGARILLSYAKEMSQPAPTLPADVQAALRPPPPGFHEISTLIRFMVGTDGQVSDCAIVQSTAPAQLADSACRILVSRGHYIPARAPDGTPIAQAQTLRFRWQLPDSQLPSAKLIPAADHAASRKTEMPPPAAKPRKIYPKDDTVQTPL